MARGARQLDPALQRFIEALAHLMVKEEARETLEAQPALARMRLALGARGAGPEGTKHMQKLVDQLFVDYPECIGLTAERRVTLLAAAIEDLGAAASLKAVCSHARESGERAAAVASKGSRRVSGRR